MNSNVKYVGEIPARIGSNRVKKKNIRLLNGKPMIEYAIEACKSSTRLSDIYVNSDDVENLKFLADKHKILFYERPQQLASDSAKQDEFNYDFLKNIECDHLVMVNPVSPLIEGKDIDEAIDFYEINELDSLVSCKQEKLHAFFQNNPLNFCTDTLLPATQDIIPIDILTWNICIWNRSKFLSNFEKDGYAAFGGKFGLWQVDPMKSIKISYEEDFKMAEMILKLRGYNISSPEYFSK